MSTGRVKWFNAEKGFGFIEADDGSRDVHVNRASLQRSGLQTLVEGQKVQYGLVTDSSGRATAENLKLL